MRIRIAAAGSRGDIAPHTGLGAGLREAGHEGRPRHDGRLRAPCSRGGARVPEPAHAPAGSGRGREPP